MAKEMSDRILAMTGKLTAEVTHKIRDKVQAVNDEPRIWVNSSERTQRRNPNAPMLVVNQYRDNIDYGEASDSITATVQGSSGVVEFENVDDIKLDEMLLEKPIIEVALAELNLEQIAEDAINKLLKT
jgi:hypothetical protein